MFVLLTLTNSKIFLFFWVRMFDSCLVGTKLRVWFPFWGCHVFCLNSPTTTHMTSHMPSSHLPLKHHLPYITCSQITCASPDTPLPNSTWLLLPLTWPYSLTLAFASGFLACLPFLSHIAPLFDSYWLPPCYLHMRVSSKGYDSIFSAMTHYQYRYS